MDNYLQDARKQGFTDMPLLHKSMALQIAERAKQYEDVDMLSMIKKIRTVYDPYNAQNREDNASPFKTGINYAQTVTGSNIIRQTVEFINAKKERDEDNNFRRLGRIKSLDQDKHLILLGENIAKIESAKSPQEKAAAIQERDALQKQLLQKGYLNLYKNSLELTNIREQGELKLQTLGLADIDREESRELFAIAEDPLRSMSDLYDRSAQMGLIIKPELMSRFRLIASSTRGGLETLQSFTQTQNSLRSILMSPAIKSGSSGRSMNVWGDEDRTVKIPAQYYISQLRIQRDIEEILKDNYRKIITMEGGHSDPRHFNDEQRKATASLLSDYNNEAHPAYRKMKEGLTELEDIIAGNEKNNREKSPTSSGPPEEQLSQLKSKLARSSISIFGKMNDEQTTSTHFANRLLTSITNDLFSRQEGAAPIRVNKNMNLVFGEGTFNPINAFYDSDITDYIEEKLELRGLSSDALNEDLITDTDIIAEIQDILQTLMKEIRKMQVLEENKGDQ